MNKDARDVIRNVIKTNSSELICNMIVKYRDRYFEMLMQEISYVKILDFRIIYEMLNGADKHREYLEHIVRRYLNTLVDDTCKRISVEHIKKFYKYIGHIPTVPLFNKMLEYGIWYDDFLPSEYLNRVELKMLSLIEKNDANRIDDIVKVLGYKESMRIAIIERSFKVLFKIIMRGLTWKR